MERIESAEINDQTWMTTNLAVAHYRNGDPIRQAISNEEWIECGNLEIGAWTYFRNDPSHFSNSGKLYNWFALNDPRGITPTGWCVPSYYDWQKLLDFLKNHFAEPSTELKSEKMWDDINYLWRTQDFPGTNSIRFAAIPTGYRNLKVNTEKSFAQWERIQFYRNLLGYKKIPYYSGGYQGDGVVSAYWSSTEGDFGNLYAWYLLLQAYKLTPDLEEISKSSGIAIRCIKDEQSIR